MLKELVHSRDEDEHHEQDYLMHQQASTNNNDDNNSKKPFFTSKGKVTITILISLVILVFVLSIGGVVIAAELVRRFSPKDPGVTLNIHIKLSQECTQQAMDINFLATQYDKTQQINFVDQSLPHISLYLTEFLQSQVPNIIETVNKTITSWRTNTAALPCTLFNPSKFDVGGAYAMWPTVRNACVQYLCDSIVNATAQYLDPNAKHTIPVWVNGLPEPKRSTKIQMIKNYGSPNVFSEFDPHVTLAHDDKNVSGLADAFAKIPPSNCTFDVKQIGIGKVGPFGTVNRNQDVALFEVLFV